VRPPSFNYPPFKQHSIGITDSVWHRNPEINMKGFRCSKRVQKNLEVSKAFDSLRLFDVAHFTIATNSSAGSQNRTPRIWDPQILLITFYERKRKREGCRTSLLSIV
jgi:hypothetical protein